MLGAFCGVVGGVAGALLVGRDPGRGGGAAGTLRGDLDRLEAQDLAARSESAAALQAFAIRLDELERRAAAAYGTEDLAHAVGDVAKDLARLRDAYVRDVTAADQRMAELERRLDELAAVAALMPASPSRIGPPTDAEEGAWVTLARDPDSARRFSALSLLGRTRSDRSVRASIERLQDPEERVVWQALRNLGRFGERSAARDIAALLGDERVAIRHAAHEALRQLGAPDFGFDAAALPEDRRAAAEALKRWADDVQ